MSAVALAGLFYLGGGWYFAGQIRKEVTVGKPDTELDLAVVAVGPGSVTLRPLGDAPAALDADKRYGLDWRTGYGHVSSVRGRSAADVTRSLTVIRGDPPRVGDLARLRKETFPDPAAAVQAPVRDVTLDSDGVALPAWLASGRGSTWAILVHGKGVTRSEMLRLMRSTTALGFPTLNIAYRRDQEMGGGMMRFGQDEWPDLEAAVKHALDHGADRLVLLGASSGAAISAAFLEHSPLRKHVAAMVFDAPMLDLAATVEHGAADRELPLVGLPLPDSLVWSARQIADLRFGLDVGRTDYLDDTAWLTVPTLVHHGTADGTVPPTVTERLAAARPDLVEYVLVEDAGHVESWNTAPEAYDARVRRFLAPYAP